MMIKPTLKVVAALLSLSSLICQLSTVYAQSPEFTYQGRLATNGVPVEGAYDFEFRLFDDPAAGNQLSSTNRLDDVAIVGGVFTVTLDFGDVSFNGNPRWLEIAVRPGASTNGYTALSPRQPITATPYAIQSASAGSAEFLNGTVAASQLTGTISSNQIGAGAITGDKLANGAVGANQLAAGAVGSNHLGAGAVTTTALADGAVTADKVFAAPALVSSVVLTNPTPLAGDQFGSAIAVGADRILVGANLDDAGATNSGAAHLFDAAGKRLWSFSNPTFAVDDNFGFAVAAVGSDKFLVGAYQDDTGALNAGSAYLFNTNGALLLTLTNPSPAIADGFGSAVAAVGSEMLLVSSFRDNPGGGQFGAAYLYDLPGNLVQAFTNPTPANLDAFGTAVAVVGTDKVLIGAPNDDVGANNSGVVHLFGTNGTLLLTLTNPTPTASDAFGDVVVAVGTDKVLITAPSDDTGASGAGAAYLFDLTGTLLTTFTNPTPAINDAFGSAAAAVGTDRVLVGAANDDTGAANAGAAYLFDLAGNLILTFTNPAPATSDLFGSAVAALDSHRVLVGAQADDTGVNDAGAVHLLTIDTFAPGLVADAVRIDGVSTEALVDEAVTTQKILDGTIGVADLSDNVLSNTFWRMNGNAGTFSQFLGTTDFRSFEIRVFGERALLLQPRFFGVSVVAGSDNSVSGSDGATIAGGRLHNIRLFSDYSAIGGGEDNYIDEDSTHATIAGGATNYVGKFSGYSMIGGGENNRIGTNSNHNTIGAGENNSIGNQSRYNTIGGGLNNLIASNLIGTAIGGGSGNLIDTNAHFSTVGGGIANVIATDSRYAAIGGGRENEIGTNSDYSTIGGGEANLIRANSDYATIPGGTDNAATNYAFAAGRGAKANHQGSFVWGDSQTGDIASTTNNQVTFRCLGGVRFLTDDTPVFSNQQVAWTPGSGSWTFSSDRDLKENFQPVEMLAVLDKVCALPITEWNYKGYSQRHIGPMAQDFHRQFPLNENDKALNDADLHGVTLAAIQGLNQKTENSDRKAADRIQKLEADNAELTARLMKLEQLILARSQDSTGKQ